MGKATAEIGAIAAARKFSAKLGTRINESTMRGLKTAYELERQLKRRREDEFEQWMQPDWMSVWVQQPYQCHGPSLCFTE